MRRAAVSLLILVLCSACLPIGHAAPPTPLLTKGHPADWWFVFKFNAATFPGCAAGATRACLFGGTVKDYKAFSQQFVYASNEHASLQQGSGCVGDTTTDPIGATLHQIYNNNLHYFF